MLHRNIRTYLGPVKAVILDWSGTVSDKYVIAPAVVFRDVFASKGITVSMKEARAPMGLRKDLHIRAMLMDNTRIQNAWTKRFGSPPCDTDVQALFEDFIPLQLNCLEKYGEIIPGARKAIETMRKEYNIKIGSTTGFIRPMVDILEREANKQGVFFDCTVAGDEVTTGFRPTPHMVYKNLDLLGIYPISSVIKVDDTVGGVGEGLHAGCWAVGVSKYSNYMNINSLDEAKALSKNALIARNKISKKKLLDAGAHYVIDSLAELPEIIDIINCKLQRGETPQSQPVI